MSRKTDSGIGENNIEMLTRVLNFSKQGPMMQLFVLDRLRSAARLVRENEAAVLVRMKGSPFDGPTWVACAKELEEEIEKHLGMSRGPNFVVECPGGFPCYVTFQTYKNGRIAIELLEVKNHLRYATASVNLADVPLADPRAIFMKGWGENKGIPEVLVAAGIIGESFGRKEIGFVEASLHAVQIPDIEAWNKEVERLMKENPPKEEEE